MSTVRVLPKSGERMTRLPYMLEPWFATFEAEIERSSVGAVAKRLGVSHAAVSMVRNGAGPYGDGSAGTRRFAARVAQMLGQVACPFLAATTGEDAWISGDKCREYAYRAVPTSSPLATRHWQACRKCERRVSAPRGWDEATRQFIDLKAVRGQLRRASGRPVDSSPGVAVPGLLPTEKEAA